jgi:NAD(P)-dependent dehydrogenase (short-subunit alcohol dehydrogenase family)
VTDSPTSTSRPVTWVTGGSSGIGRAVVAGAIERGDVVGILDRQPPTEPVPFARCDVADVTSVDAACAALRAEIGLPRNLVLCAGVVANAPVADHDLGVWQHVLDVNLTGALFVLRSLVGDLCAARNGRIVTVSSGSAVRVGPGSAAYSASKAGLIALTKVVALEVAPFGVTANVVAPGVTRTPMTVAAFGGDEAIDVAAVSGRLAIPQGRPIEAGDVADAVLFLASDGASRITGQVVHVNGGSVMP